MATRKIKGVRDPKTGELVYIKGHAQAVFMSDGGTVEDAINIKQDKLVSGIDVKTINGESILGQGNIEIIGSGQSGDKNVQPDWNEIDTSSDAYIKNKPFIPDLVNEETVENWGFTKNVGDVTSVVINDDMLYPEDGIIDLGNVLREHQDISHLATKDEIPSLDGYITTENLNDALSGKQDVLISGVHIKTINGQSIIGEGNLDITSGGVGMEDTDDVIPDVSSNTYIKYVAQSLTEEQQAQARANLGIKGTGGADVKIIHSWDEYDENLPDDYVIPAKLGYDLYTRLLQLEEAIAQLNEQKIITW